MKPSPFSMRHVGVVCQGDELVVKEKAGDFHPNVLCSVMPMILGWVQTSFFLVIYLALILQPVGMDPWVVV